MSVSGHTARAATGRWDNRLFSFRAVLMAAPPNRLLHGLPHVEAVRLEGLYEPFELIAGDMICQVGADITHVVFPHSGVISIVADVRRDLILELTLLGAEGMFGVPVVLGASVADTGAIVQADGYATRIGARAFVAVLADCPVLEGRLRRYTHALLMQISQTVICNIFHSIEQRTARWILTMADRTRSNEIRMTQAFLAGMLGVRRQAVSEAAVVLHDSGLIRYARGSLEILDRAGLERASCFCYARTEHFYR
jgi:CRP-like cAMP-binding protein